MKIKLKKYSLLLMAIVMVAVSALTVYAADPTSGSLTIILHEIKNENATTTPVMAGIEYTLYKVDDTCEDITDAQTYVNANSVTGTAKISGADGKIVYDNLALGRYYAKVTGVTDGVSNEPESFIVDIPMTNTAGTGLVYDVTVEPKVFTAYGNIEFTKVDESGNPIQGVTFKVQVMKAAVNGDLEDLEMDVWTDYIPEGASTVLTVTTGADGNVTLNNLPEGTAENRTGVIYRLVETAAPEGYIINNEILSSFMWYIASDGSIITNYDYLTSGQKQFFTVTTEDNLTKVQYMNEKPTITKQVKNSAGTYVEVAGINATDTVVFKITADLPEQIADMTTYKLTDVLPAGLTLDRTSITVEGNYGSGHETLTTDAYSLSDTGLVLTFDTTKISSYYDIVVTYNATVDMDNITIGGDGNVNTATLEYTSKISEDGSEEDTATTTDTANVHTGALKIEKVEKGNTATKLAGAKFKIAATKANAEAGTFVKDADGNDIEVTTDANGIAEIKGLAYADDGSDTSYWLVETQAPTYTDTVDGQTVTKSYNLLKNPVEVQVGKTTYETAVQVQNSKGLDLPATGGIGIAIFAVVGMTIMVISKKMSKEEVK
ncbi:MAG: SpaH/EbpB family LPXTG-anchored major pilin [Clostridia bacterium]|nr:SpaH/EbpB family LPXTG-anchored major pilin [Clostridia bacterium]